MAQGWIRDGGEGRDRRGGAGAARRVLEGRSGGHGGRNEREGVVGGWARGREQLRAANYDANGCRASPRARSSAVLSIPLAASISSAIACHHEQLVFLPPCQTPRHAFQSTRPPDGSSFPSPLYSRDHAWFAQVPLHASHTSGNTRRALRCFLGLVCPSLPSKLQLQPPSSCHPQRGPSEHRHVKGASGYPRPTLWPHIQEGGELLPVQVSIPINCQIPFETDTPAM